MTIILDGRAVASAVMEEQRVEAQKLRDRGIVPALAIVLVGEDKFSKQYVEMKARRCREVCVEPRIHHLPPKSSQSDILRLIEQLNCDSSVHGLMVQLPLPREVDELSVVEAISIKKDVDGLSPASLGKVLVGGEAFVPAGVEAILELLRRYAISPEKKHWVIAGLSNIVGKPLSALLMNMDVTLTCCRGNEPDLVAHIRSADVLLVDVMRKNAVTAEMVKRGCVVLDNGNNYVGKKVYGDVDFDGVKEVASAITPAPGGIGPVLIAMLIANTIRAAASRSS